MHNKKQSWWYGIGGTMALAAIIGVVSLLPDIKRYMKLRSM